MSNEAEIRTTNRNRTKRVRWQNTRTSSSLLTPRQVLSTRGNETVTELGFWKLANADPDRVALVDPDGNERTAGELLTIANQVSHGLRAQGLEAGDTVACVLPNGLEMIELYLGAMQIGLYLTPINHHLVGPEIAYIVNDSDAKVFVGHERYADEITKAMTEIELPADKCFAVGGVEGLRPWTDLVAGQPVTAPTIASPARRCTTRRAPPDGRRA